MNINIVIIVICLIVILPFLIAIVSKKRKEKGKSGFSCKSCKNPAICFQSQCLTNTSCLIKNVQTGLYLDIMQTQNVNYLCGQYPIMTSGVPTKSQCFINGLNDDGTQFRIFIAYKSSDGNTEYAFVLTHNALWYGYDPNNQGFYYENGKLYSADGVGKLIALSDGTNVTAIIQSPTYVGQSNDQWEIEFVPNILK